MKFRNKKIKIWLITTVAFIAMLGVFSMVNSSQASWQWVEVGILKVVGLLVGVVVSVLGAVISVVIDAVIGIAKYNNFINEAPIIEAWVLVRDLCNMFFILILLLIAFATILRYENYSIKRLLPKLVIMAVLINFSRMICGLIIDAGQIVMLTFVSAFADGGGNFMEHLGVKKFLTLVSDQKWDAPIDLASSLAALVSGIIFLTISAVVMIVMLAVLAIRVVMIWIYVVLSPLAFLLMAFPGGQKYASQWWRDFTTQVVAGPLLAFFIWLSLITVAQVNSLGALSTSGKCYGWQEIFCPDVFLNFVIAIGMLIGGLIMTSKLGGAIGAAAGSGMARINQGKALMIKGGKKAVTAPIRGAADTALSSAARSERVTGWLTNRATSDNALTRISGVGRLSRAALGSLGYRERQVEEKAEKYVAKFGNRPAVIESLARRDAVAPLSRAIRDKAMDRAPHSRELADAQDWYNGASPEKIRNLKPDAWTELAHVGVQFEHNPEGGALLHANSSKGISTNAAVVRGGGVIPGLGAIAGSPPRIGADRRFKTDKTKEDKVIESNKLKERRENYGGFGAGSSNMIITDLNKLRKQELGDVVPKPEEHRGVSLHNQEDISKVASGLIKAIEARVKGIEAGSIKPNTKNELKHLNQAKERLSKPEDLKNLQLVHTESKRGDIAHEVIHGAGAVTEPATEKLESSIVQGEMKLAQFRKTSVGRAKTPDEIIKLERGSERDKDKEKVEIGETITNKTTETIIKDKAAADTLKDPFKASSDNLIYFLKQVSKGLTNLSFSQTKLAKSISGKVGAQNKKGEDTSRLEIEVAVNKIKEEMNT